MHEVRVESLDKLETQGSQRLLSANAGSLRILFPQEVWEDLLANAPVFEEPAPEELRELELLRERLEQFAREQSFASVLGGVECRPSSGRCSRAGSAGGTLRPSLPGRDNPCRS